MLLKRRIDYLIEYPVSIRYAAKKAGVNPYQGGNGP